MGISRVLEIVLWVFGFFFIYFSFSLSGSNIGGESDFEPQYDLEFFTFLTIGTSIFWLPALLIHRNLRDPIPTKYISEETKERENDREKSTKTISKLMNSRK